MVESETARYERGVSEVRVRVVRVSTRVVRHRATAGLSILITSVVTTQKSRVVTNVVITITIPVARAQD